MNWEKPPLLIMGMMRNQYIVFLLQRQGKPWVKMKKIGSFGVKVSQIKKPLEIGIMLIINVIQERVEELKITIRPPRMIAKFSIIWKNVKMQKIKGNDWKRWQASEQGGKNNIRQSPNDKLKGLEFF